MRRRMFTLNAYKFSLSGALILLLDLRSGCTGEGSAAVLGDTDSVASAEEQAALTGDRGALLVLNSPRSTAHEMELATGTSSGTSSLGNLKDSPVARRWRRFLWSVPLFSVATRYECGVSATCRRTPGVQVPLAGLKTRMGSSGNSGRSGCQAVLLYCTFCLSSLSCGLTLMSPSAEIEGFDTAGRFVWYTRAIQKLYRWRQIMTEGGTTEAKHSQMRIVHSLHCPLTKTIGLRLQGTGCDVSRSIVTTELLEGGRCILWAIVSYQFTWDSTFFEDRLQVCNDCRWLDAGELFYHRKFTIVVND